MNIQPSFINPDEHRTMVLLVDDQAIIAEAIRRALATQPDIDFHFCNDPTRAIDMAIRVKPTVILQDLVMPQMDGLTLVRAFRADERVKDVPIIVLSTKEDPQIKSDSFTAGTNDYLVKLPDKLELIARVRYHSRAYIHQLQRDEAYRALRESQQNLVSANTALLSTNQALESALAQVKQLHGLLPICCCCKKIRHGDNYWEQVESYIVKHSEAKFTHTYCDECYENALAELDAEKHAQPT